MGPFLGITGRALQQTLVDWKGFVPSLSAHPLPSAASKEREGLALSGQAH